MAAEDPYELIREIPATKEGVQAAIEHHAKIFNMFKAAATYDQWLGRAKATANLNQLFDGKISDEAYKEATESLGKFATSAA